MAKKSQIKNVIIKTKTEGSQKAIDELNSIDGSLGRINESTKDLIGSSRSMAKAFGMVSTATRSLDKSAKSIAEVGKSLNTAFNGGARHTKNIDSYATNVEFLQSVLKDFNATAVKSGSVMTGLNKSFANSPMMGISGDLNTIIGQLQEMVESLDDLNIGTRISNKRLKQARDYIADVGQASDLSAEQLEELARAQRIVGSAAKRTEPEVDRFNNGLRRMNTQGSSTTRGFSDMVFGMNPLVSAYAAVAVNVYALSEAFRLLEEAAAFDRLQTQLASFSAGVSGINVRRLAADLQEASGQALTFKESIDLSAQGTAFNFTADQMVRLTTLTRKASIALGRNFADSMERVTKGIAKQEIEVLDEIGVVTRLETAFNNYGKTVGKSAKELSEYERQLALTAEVERQLTEKYNGIDSKATQWEKLSAAIRTSTTEGTIHIAKFLEPAAGYLEKMVSGYQAASRARQKDLQDMKDQAKTFEIASQKGNIGVAVNSFAQLEQQQKALQVEQRKVLEENKALRKQFEENYSFLGRAASKFNKEFLSIGALGTTGFGKALIPDNALVMIEDTHERYQNIKSSQEEISRQMQTQYDTLVKMEPALAFYDSLGGVAGELLGLNKSLKESEDVFTVINTESTKTGSSIEKAVSKLDLMENSLANLRGLSKPIDLVAEAFERIKNTIGATDFESPKQLKEALLGYEELAKSTPTDLAISKVSLGGQDNSNLKSLIKERESILNLQKASKNIGTAVSNTTREEWAANLRVLDAKIAKEKLDIRTKELIQSNTLEYEKQQAILNAQGRESSVIVDNKIKQLQAERAILSRAGAGTDSIDNEILSLKIKRDVAAVTEKINEQSRSIAHESSLTSNALSQAGANQVQLSEAREAELELLIETRKSQNFVTTELERQLSLVKQKTKFAKEDLALQAKLASLEIAGALVEEQAANGPQNARAAVETEQTLLDLKRAKVLTMKDEIAQAQALAMLDIEQRQLDNTKNAAPARDAASAFGQLQGLDGLSDLQQGGLQIGESLSTAFADAAEAGKEGFTGMVSYLSENSEAFTEMSMGLANAAGSMFQSITKNKIDGIDREIEAEKRRDGKSAESLAKIKKLEAKKIKEQAKASKAQVIMSTSVAIMRAFQDMGIFGAAPAAIMAGFGAMQISQINAAANGQLAALNSGGSGGMTITGGERDNKVDVSSRAQSGESAFYSGMSNNLPGRSGGGRQEAGDAVVLGEVGPEIFIPDVPGTVVPSGRATNTDTSGMSMSIQINAIDSASLIERIDEISETIYENVEKELRARNNSSLDNIG